MWSQSYIYIYIYIYIANSFAGSQSENKKQRRASVHPAQLPNGRIAQLVRAFG